MRMIRRTPTLVALVAILLAALSGAGTKPSAARVATGIVAREPLVAVSRSTGRLMPGFPQVSGVGVPGLELSVRAIADDGGGGWYVGGDFKLVGGVVCPNLVHIRRDFSVDASWCPRPDGEVWALLRVGSTLYVGGNYMRRIAGEKWPGIAAFDTATGGIATWNPKVLWGGGPAVVDELAENRSGSVIYASGSFDTVGGKSRTDFAAVSANSGRATAFAPNPVADYHQDSVDGFAVTDTRVYTWGNYVEIGGQKAHWSLAALDPRSGKLVAWEPALDGAGSASAASVIGDRVIIGGFFTRLDGQPRDCLGSFPDARAPSTPGHRGLGQRRQTSTSAPWPRRATSSSRHPTHFPIAS